MSNESAVLQRDLRHTYPRAVSAEGHYIVDSEGMRYFDASGGAAISCLGHCQEDVLRALLEQARRLDFAHTAFFSNAAVEELADFLCSRAPSGLTHAYFSCGGSEAMEAAFKIAHQYFQERGEGSTRRWIIAREQSYHGNTLGALSFGNNGARRVPYSSILLQQDKVESCVSSWVSACDLYRGLNSGESHSDYTARLASELEDKIKELGAENVIAFAAETVSGSTLGAMPPTAGYWQAMREVCDRHGILLILDEVMCGSGRTGYLFACQEDGISPDLLAMSKGLGGGVQPIGATLVASHIVEAMRAGSGVLRHGHSFMSHPIICATALATQRVIEEQDLLTKVRADGEALQGMLSDGLQTRARLAAHIGDIRGRGLLRAVELVADKASKRPFPVELCLYKRVRECALAQGLICYPGAGNADGVSGDHILLAPPFTMTSSDMDFLVSKLYDSLEQVFSELDIF